MAVAPEQFRTDVGPGGRRPGVPAMRSAPVKTGAASPPAAPTTSAMQPVNVTANMGAIPSPTGLPPGTPIPVAPTGTMGPGTSGPGGTPPGSDMIQGPGLLPIGPGMIPTSPFPGLNTTTVTPEQTLRNQRLNFNFDAPQIGDRAVAAPQGLDFSAFSMDPSQFTAGGQFGYDMPASAGSGFRVTPQSVMEQAMKTFQSQIPGLQQALMDETEGLSKRTAAMGRTGSGLFNRDTGLLSDRALATREGLLGNLAMQAATTDAGNDLQAQIATGGFDQAAKQRLLQGSMFGSELGQRGLFENARLNQSGQMFDIGNRMNVDLANASRGQQADMFNVNTAMQTALERLGLGERQQGREDKLASQAMQDLAAQMGFLGQGFQGNPANTALQGGNLLAQLAGMFGSNAAQTSAGLGQAGAALGSGATGGGLLGNILGGALGGGIPQRPAPIPEPTPIGIPKMTDFSEGF